MQPDWVWIKNRSNAFSHCITDSVRGTNLQLASNSTGSDQSTTDGITSFNSNGFSLGAGTQQYSSNTNSQTYVAWQWDAGTSTVTNTSGTISSQVRANTSAGFSVVTYTGTGSASDTVGHGLGLAPAMVITKRRNGSGNWMVKHQSLASSHNLLLEETLASTNVTTSFSSGGIANLSSSTTFGFLNGTAGTPNNANTSGATYVAYCFSEVAGYSRFGSFTGNGSSDNAFIYTGFRPRYVLIKQTNDASNWFVHDTARSTYNVADKLLRANLSDAELTPSTIIDIVSNGIKIRDSGFNGNYVYACFAENPFKYSLAR
jgi:hypothetical protein